MHIIHIRVYYTCMHRTCIHIQLYTLRKMSIVVCFTRSSPMLLISYSCMSIHFQYVIAYKIIQLLAIYIWLFIIACQPNRIEYFNLNNKLAIYICIQLGRTHLWCPYRYMEWHTIYQFHLTTTKMLHNY